MGHWTLPCKGKVRGTGAFGQGLACRRTRQQHLLLAAAGRTAKLTKRYKCKVQSLTSAFNEVGKGAMKKRKHRLCFRDILQLSFDKRKNRHALSDRYEVSRLTVVRALQVTAGTVLEVQLRQLNALLEFAESHKPDFGCLSFTWDETGERLSLQPVQNTPLQPQSTWQILVTRCQFGIGWKEGVKIYHEMVMPPVPLVSNSCNNIWNGIFRHPLLSPITSLVFRLMLACNLRLCTFESDGHLANEKLTSFQVMKEMEKPVGDQVLMDTVLCQNHQCNLAVVHLVNSAGTGSEGKVLPNMYCCALFLRMGCHYVRLQASIQVLIHKADIFEWIPYSGRTDVLGHLEFADELSSYLVDNLPHHDKNMALYDDSYTARQQRAHNIHHCFTRVLNGPYWKRDKIVHMCTHRNCCRTPDEAKEKVIEALLKVLFRQAPIIPMLSDWTKVGPSMDFFLACEHQGILSLLLEHAQWAFRFDQKAADSGSVLDPEGEIEWHALAGRRFQRSRRTLACNWTLKSSLVLLCLVCVWFLTGFVCSTITTDIYRHWLWRWLAVTLTRNPTMTHDRHPCLTHATSVGP